MRRPCQAPLLLLVAALACDDRSEPLAPPADPAADVRIQVDPASPGPRIPPDFLGLGFEMPVMADPALAGDPVFERLLATIGPGTLRFGGNSLERTRWQPAGGVSNDEFQLTPPIVDGVFAFARRTGWHVTVALDLSRYDPAAAADEAAYLVRAGGEALQAIEIGNEPNLFPLRGLRSSVWTADSLAEEFDGYADAILARAPGTPLAGPATWCTGGGRWIGDFLARVRHQPAFASHHFYPTGVPAPAGSFEEATVANLLSAGVMARTRACVDSAAVAAGSHGLALRVNETNSTFGFGRPGVSDVFASALWGLDHLLTLAEVGVAGVNVQTGTDLWGGLDCDGIYLPMCGEDGRWTARPLYYALLAVREMAPGRILPLRLTAAANVAAHAVLGDDGIVRVAVINQEEARGAIVTIKGACGARRGEALMLRAPSLLSKTGVTLGEAAVGDDGTWAPAATVRLDETRGGWLLELPSASAAIVALRPAAWLGQANDSDGCIGGHAEGTAPEKIAASLLE
ncbi:MAG TPA: hypothetical protein VEB59_01685 [Gemmatimonadales bacterium]|nr:hypothetical protein [Gemmatimonadales bacterium]